MCLLGLFDVIPPLIIAAVVLVFLLIADRKSLAKVDYSLLLTFVALFIFIGNMKNIDVFKNFLSSVISGNEEIVAVLASQVISNVPAALLLSGFSSEWQALIVGCNLGGLGTLIDMDTVAAEGATLTHEYDDDEYVAGYPVYSGGTISIGRQAFGQYPTGDVIARSVVMEDFGDDLAGINQMWINVRCLDVADIPVTTVVIVAAVIVVAAVAIVLYRFRYTIFYSGKKRGK